MGYVGTVFFQSYYGSSPTPEKPNEVHEERDNLKRLDFDVRKLSEELAKKEQDLKAREKALAQAEASLKVAKAVAERGQTEVVREVVDGTETVTVVEEMPEENKPVRSTDPVRPTIPEPVYEAPRRPAVFDGGGSAPVVSASSGTVLLYFQDPVSGSVTQRVVSKDIAEEVKRLRDLLKQLEKEKRELENGKEGSDADIKAKEGEIIALKSQLANFEEKADVLTKQLTEAEKEKDEQRKKAEKDEESAYLRGKIEGRTAPAAEARALRKEKREANDKISKQSDEINRQKSALERLQKNFNDEKKKNDEAAEDLEAERNKNKDLEDAKKISDDGNEKKRKEIERLQNILNDKEREWQNKEDELNRKTLELEEWRKKLEKLQSELNAK